LIYPHFNAYNMQELRAVILMKEKTITGYLTRKEYKKLLAQRERIKNFIEQEKLNKEHKEQSL
ncbi:MAG: hypothetical protein IJ371_00770, partial [Clostridia bacterium]|nr:hypothetical protein [Clostridia bacterium]